MLKLYQFERTWGIPNLSPFCCKIETYLRMAGVEYEIKPALPFGAPKGKLPYIKDNSETIGDSRFIINYLKSNYKDLDKGLSDAEVAISVAMQRLLDEHLFWVLLYSRWQYTDENWRVNKKAIFGGLPPLIRDMVANRWRPKIKRQIYGHGIGRHQIEEIFTLGKQDIDALSAYLGSKQYFLGDQPTTLDASAFSHFINIIGCPIESPLKEYGLSKNNLLDFIDRIKKEFYQDLESSDSPLA
ncbi:glutathione S-transferase family protein [Nitrosomonas communis]|uniref:Glutathione S-transferase n=1 Tax=Nitrosomonas communis TaxID=44574 RepID=A0A1I4TSQ3_9PROT|nr:glutathione S-transferase family protein [Nitrosomonas communis]SFM79573.1 Glutathione S-transferase [Nitrosomonas communis]